MKSLKAILTSSALCVVLAGAAAIIGFIFAESLDSLFLGGSVYPLGVFQRSIIAMLTGIFGALVGLALYMFFSFSFGCSRSRGRGAGRNLRGDESYGASLGQTAAFAEMSTGDSFPGGETRAGADAVSGDNQGFESGGVGFEGGDAGGGGSGGDFGGGDFGGGDSGGDGGGGGGD